MRKLTIGTAAEICGRPLAASHKNSSALEKNRGPKAPAKSGVLPADPWRPVVPVLLVPVQNTVVVVLEQSVLPAAHT